MRLILLMVLFYVTSGCAGGPSLLETERAHSIPELERLAAAERLIEEHQRRAEEHHARWQQEIREKQRAAKPAAEQAQNAWLACVGTAVDGLAQHTTEAAPAVVAAAYALCSTEEDTLGRTDFAAGGSGRGFAEAVKRSASPRLTARVMLVRSTAQQPQRRPKPILPASEL